MRYKEIKNGVVTGELDTDEVTAATINAMSDHSGLVLEPVTGNSGVEPEPEEPAEPEPEAGTPPTETPEPAEAASPAVAQTEPEIPAEPASPEPDQSATA